MSFQNFTNFTNIWSKNIVDFVNRQSNETVIALIISSSVFCMFGMVYYYMQAVRNYRKVNTLENQSRLDGTVLRYFNNKFKLAEYRLNQTTRQMDAEIRARDKRISELETEVDFLSSQSNGIDRDELASQFAMLIGSLPNEKSVNMIIDIAKKFDIDISVEYTSNRKRYTEHATRRKQPKRACKQKRFAEDSENDPDYNQRS